jgi:two-component system, OmpR family, response regulator
MNKRRLLVVDDEAAITRLLKLNLEQTGLYDVRELNSSLGVVPAARMFRPDLILMDVMMPDMEGGEVAALLQQDPELRRIPVVFLTAAVRKEELGGPAGKIGGRYYIAKPLNVQQVLAVLERTLGAASGSPAPS